MFKLKFDALLVSLLVSAMTSFVFAGNPQLFRVQPSLNVGQSAEISQALDAKKKDKSTKNARSVSADVNVLRENVVDIDLGNGTILTVRKKAIQDGETADSWTGTAMSNPLDHVVFVINGNRITGSLNVGNKLYSIEPVGDSGEHVLVEKDMSVIKECATQ